MRLQNLLANMEEAEKNTEKRCKKYRILTNKKEPKRNPNGAKKDRKGDRKEQYEKIHTSDMGF